MAREFFSFKCGNGVVPGCDWCLSGDNEALLIFQIEMHAQNGHHLGIGKSGTEKIRRTIMRGTAEEAR